MDKDAEVLMFIGFKSEDHIGDKAPAAVIFCFRIESQVEVNHISHSKHVGKFEKFYAKMLTMRVFG